ncbi:MAG: serine hydrolase domain-containing protein [Actinoplanes sp.]
MVDGVFLVKQGDEVVTEQIAEGRTAATRYQLASVSKQFTAAAILVLAQAGRLQLDDPVGKWAGGWDGITLHQLLSHTSGLGHWEDYPMIDLCRGMTPDELIATFRLVPPSFQGYYYSSPGYVLLAHVVEQAGDQPYREFLADRVFGPAGLTATFAGSPGDRPDVAQGHDKDGKPVPSFDLDSVGMGAGDVWSTAADMVAWLDALRAGRVLNDHWRDLMLHEHVPTGLSELSRAYGYGVFLGALNGEPIFQHSGDNAGFKAFVACVPGPDRRIVVLTDTDSLTSDQMHEIIG